MACRATLAVLAAAALPACLEAPPASGDGGDGDGEGPVQLLVNPSFEEGVAGWDREGSVEIATTDDLALPDSEAGELVALLGRVDDDLDILYQEVTVPAWAQMLEVTGTRCFTTSEEMVTAFDVFWIYLESPDGLESEDVVEASNRDATAEGCVWQSFRAPAFDHAGEEVVFVIEASNDEDYPTSFAVDDLALTAYP